MTFTIPLTGSTVVNVSDGFSVELVTSDGHTVIIENNFEVRGANASRVVASGLGKFSLESAIFEGARIDDARYDEKGFLTISFDNGSQIAVGSDEDYESWQVAGPGGSKIICMPSGDVASWS